MAGAVKTTLLTHGVKRFMVGAGSPHCRSRGFETSSELIIGGLCIEFTVGHDKIVDGSVAIDIVSQSVDLNSRWNLAW